MHGGYYLPCFAFAHLPPLFYRHFQGEIAVQRNDEDMGRRQCVPRLSSDETHSAALHEKNVHHHINRAERGEIRPV